MQIRPYPLSRLAIAELSGRGWKLPRLIQSLRILWSEIDLYFIVVRNIHVDEHAALTLLNIIQRNQRKLNSIEVMNCEGKIESSFCTAILNDRVRQVKLINVHLDQSGFQALGEALRVNTSVSYLRLTALTLSAKAVEAIIKGLIKNKTLSSLDLKWSNFDNEAAVHELAKGLSENKCVRSLILSGCGLEDSQVAILLRFLTGHPSLEGLDLDGNKCGREASAALSTVLRDNKCRIRNLNLSCQRVDIGCEMEFHIISQGLAANNSVISLDISNNRVRDEDLEWISLALIKNRTLHDLNLARNKITQEGIVSIAKSIHHMRGLKKLSLWGNEVTETGANALCLGLRENFVVESLTLFQEFSCSNDIQRLTFLNRAGRSIFQAAPNSVPSSLWPFLLARINAQQMANRSRGCPASEELTATADALFYFLQGPVLFNNRC